MNGKKLIGMAVMLIVLVGIGVMQQKGSTHKQTSKTAEAEKPLLAGIDLNAITSLEVNTGSNAMVLVKTDGCWNVEALSGYPVDFKSMANAVRAMAEVKLGAPVRANHVEATEFGFGKDDLKIVLKAGDSVVATVEVGAQRNASETAGWANQHFIRKTGNKAIYLVDYDFRPFSEKPEDWIKRQILNVRSADIVSVKTGKVELKLDGADWKLTDLNAEKEELQYSEADKLRRALQCLNCKTIADASQTEVQLGFTNTVKYVAQTKDGFTYTATLGGEVDGGRYVRFAVAYTKPAAPTAPSDEANQAQKDAYQKEKDAFKTTCETNAKKGTDINSNLAKWTYLISSNEAADFLIGRDKLVKEKELLSEKDDEQKEPE